MLKNTQLTLIFLHWPYALKNCGPCSGATQAASMDSVSLRRLVGVAQGPIGSNQFNRLKADPVNSTCFSGLCTRPSKSFSNRVAGWPNLYKIFKYTNSKLT